MHQDDEFAQSIRMIRGRGLGILLIWIVGAAIAIQNARMPAARFAVTEEVCLPSSRSRPQERQYTVPALGVVLSGCIDYRAQSGSAIGAAS